jgi:hypothetical protein
MGVIFSTIIGLGFCRLGVGPRTIAARVKTIEAEREGSLSCVRYRKGYR